MTGMLSPTDSWPVERFSKAADSYTPRSAFSLLELIVATSIFTLLVALVLYLASGILNSWNRATGGLSADMRARICLEYLARDLEGAYFENNREVWLIAERMTEQEGFDETVWLRFFTTAPDRTEGEPGGLNAISYQLAYTNPADPSSVSGKVSGLYRTKIDAKRTFQEYLGNLQEKERSDFLDISSREIVSSSFLAASIVTFQATFWTREATGDNGEAVNLPLNSSDETAFPLYREGFPRGVLPEFADISITVLSGEGERLYEALHAGTDVGLSQEEIIKRFGLVYGQRVNFLSDAL